ncbi:sterol desaturase family protein [Rhizorhabdus histidinilytica]|uniref:Sterol desaturase/sphingolipid hydroxylase, fatty acid hydroxylase superfamily n=1 Tax=Rhizorhabdus histidinilytica TaxID=439228 RepID=A0A1T5BRS3_9SPHN|nr:sterol desaturase family protein [Rhizorhabdus histidinilytica]SKB49968.1 Sterol desaturase/sphingolipid hydroxylase, fatty acid hydroxylase superfamily [Rhizorhabdus histidinilytica]
MLSLFESLPLLGRVVVSQIIWLFLFTALFVPLERLAGVHRQPTRRPQMLVDLGYFFLSGLIPVFVLSFPLGAITALSRQALPESYHLWITGLPVAIQVGLAILIGEFGFYWGHRIMHQVPWLWRFHAIHHEPVRMDWLVNTRTHPVDLVFTRMFGLSLVYIAGLGTPGSGSGSIIPLIVLLVGTFWGFFIHSNLNVRLGLLEHVLSSPRFHHWHHSRVDHVNRNYASTLPIYDRLFGTHHLPRQWPPSYGIAPENRPEVLIAAQYGEADETPPAPARDATSAQEGSRASNTSNSCAIDPSTSMS